ncbi:MAG TPA: hypothetical protein VGQ67_10040 [Candidatus Polarisedimenticolia bacterium]|nr:hypothetical protein [Candidatus Polarisedimenticolia bacterium]
MKVRSFKRSIKCTSTTMWKIDRLIIYMRPIPVAQKFAEAITQRLQPTR